MKLRYNAPVALTFCLVCFVVLMLDQVLRHELIRQWFTAPGKGSFDAANIPAYLRLVSYTLGHSGWDHLIGNVSFLLLLGPILEEKHGSPSLAVMMAITALTTAVFNLVLFPTGILGASGMVFMFILLSSFTNVRRGEIPLTFVLVVVIFMTKEFVAAFQHNNASELGHILGGVCGAAFGFVTTRKEPVTAPTDGAEASSEGEDSEDDETEDADEPPAGDARK